MPTRRVARRCTIVLFEMTMLDIAAAKHTVTSSCAQEAYIADYDDSRLAVCRRREATKRRVASRIAGEGSLGA